VPEFIQARKLQQDVQAVNERASRLSGVGGHFLRIPQIPLTFTLGRSIVQDKPNHPFCTLVSNQPLRRPGSNQDLS
jgi:hypothetical protein